MNHLEQWLTHGTRSRPLYLPRTVYGEYLTSAGAEAVQLLTKSQHSLAVHKAEIVDIDLRGGRNDTGYLLRPRDGREFQARKVVLALGDPAPAVLSVVAEATYYPSPAPFENLRGISARAAVAIAGTGASAIDCCLYLVQDLNHSGPIQVWSRSGQLPCVQRDPARPSSGISRAALGALATSGDGLLSLSQIKNAIDKDLAHSFGDSLEPGATAAEPADNAIARFRAQIEAAETGTASPQDYVRGLRDLAPSLWKRMSIQDQRAFDEQYFSQGNRYGSVRIVVQKADALT